MRIKALVLALACVGVSCNPDTVQLSYRFEQGTETTYRLIANATARWDVGGAGKGSYQVAFDVTETVEQVDDEGATVLVQMVPVPEESREQGLPSPGLERREFSLRLGPRGDVLEVLLLDDVPGQNLDPDQLAFIGTYRPPLAEGAVRLGSTWSGRSALQVSSGFQDIETDGELSGLRRDGSDELAEIEFTGRSPLEWVTVLPQGEASLSGDAATSGEAVLDMTGGSLRSATSTTEGSFEVRVIPGSGEAPITGTLDLDLDLEVVRV